MSVYDSNVVIKCLNGEKEACKLMTNDSDCVIPPTVSTEVWSGLHKIPPNCKIYTYQTEPFNDPEIANEPISFVYAIHKVFLSSPKRGRKKKWEVSERTKKWFQRLCVEWKNGKIDENDWKILKEANILGELGLLEDKRLVSNDSHLTNDFCKAAYEHVMKYLDEIAGSEPEELEVNIVPYKDLIHKGYS